MRRVLLRADGGSEIGFGHMSRLISLASMLDRKFECWFFSCSDAFSDESDRHCSRRILLDPKDHHSEFLEYITENDIVVLDNYFFLGEYQKKIKDIGCKLVCIDDIHATYFYADVVINHAEGVGKEFYESEDYTTYLLGADYVLLRDGFFGGGGGKRRNMIF